MRFGISLKWTLSSIVIIAMVIAVYTWMMLTETQKSVDQETARIQRIQNEALDQLGAQTTKTISLPASSLMFDNDLEGLKGLIAPIVKAESKAEQSTSAVYATIIAPDGRVWVTVADDNIAEFKMAGTTYFNRKNDDDAQVEVDDEFIKELKKDNMAPANIRRDVVLGSGSKVDMGIRQYAAVIKPKKIDKGDDSAKEQGYLVIGYSIDALESEIASIHEDGENRKAESIYQVSIFAIIALALALVFAGIFAVLVTRNIKALSKVANQIGSGDLSVRSHVSSHDEVGLLSDQFNFMADRVQVLMVETEQKAMLEKEVDIARSIQTTLLPAKDYAECGPVQIKGYFQPASVCGGDFWSYNMLDDGSVLLTIGDVTGHGVPSAMITACAKSALDTVLSMSSARDFDLCRVVSSINTAICQAAKRTLFMTFLAMRISPDGRQAEIVNAGHNFPLVVRGGEVRGLVARGERLGDNPDAAYNSIRADFQSGDLLVLYTDGVTEYTNSFGAEYGEKRMRKVLAAASGADVNAAMNHLWNDFSTFCGTAPQNDDITLLFSRIS